MRYGKLWLFAFLIMTQIVGCSYKEPLTFTESPTLAVFTPTPFTAPTEEPPPFTPSPSPPPSPPQFTPSPSLPPYPPPLPTAAGTILHFSAGCPNPEGLKVVKEFRKTEALEVLNEFFSGNLEKVFQVTDPSVWPLLSSSYEREPSALVEGNLAEPRPARESPYAELLANACGDKTLDYSWWVEVCPGSPPPPEFAVCPPGVRLHYFFINREGRWLIWGFG